MFVRFEEELQRQGFSAKSGLIVDGTFVETPKQRNRRDENAQIKNGEVPETFSKDPNLLEQKDVDARRAKKGDEDHFGYKNHVVADVKHKLIRGYDVTDASVHDVNKLESVVPERAAYPESRIMPTQATSAPNVKSGCVSAVTTRKFVNAFRKQGRCSFLK